MGFNTAISQMMIFINSCYKVDIVPKKYALGFLQLLSPVAPHITEELWQRLGNTESITYSTWPEYDEEKIVEDTFNLPIQVNGKLRSNIDIALNLPEEEVKEIAHRQVASYLEGKTIVKEIYVTNKIYNIVVK
jgi:leucyl-tRNA synthetase